jgi:hypothetical protein
MTGVAVTDAMTERYWTWLLGLKNTDFVNFTGHVITKDPGGTVAFLMDPADVPNGGAFAQVTAGNLTPNQQVLIPLWLGSADDCVHCGNPPNNSQLNLTSKKKWELGRIISQVSINGANVLASREGFLDVDVCFNPGTNQVTDNYHGASNTSLRHDHTVPITGGLFMNLNIPATSHKLNQGTFVSGLHAYTTITGFWAVISPSDGGLSSWSTGNTISYSTTVGLNSIGGCSNPNPINYSATITYTVT